MGSVGLSVHKAGTDVDRHWLQEIKAENSAMNGGIPRTASTVTVLANIMNICGMVEGEVFTLRRAIRPVLKLAADVVLFIWT